MKISSLSLFSLALIAASSILVGCGSSPNKSLSKTGEQSHQVDPAELSANYAKLNDEDRALAEAQGYCAVTTEPLGSMGVPIKLVVKDQPVFVCCKGCEKKAVSNPEATLAKVVDLQARVKSQSAP